MKVYIVRSSCSECGENIVGVYATESVANKARADVSSNHYAFVDEMDVENIYYTSQERLEQFRIGKKMWDI